MGRCRYLASGSDASEETQRDSILVYRLIYLSVNITMIMFVSYMAPGSDAGEET